uniref:Uncharacterized protein n=1 Tax=Romanomermis culicivorax TaxID=13658 RepID=A0A915KN16_ROMCU
MLYTRAKRSSPSFLPPKDRRIPLVKDCLNLVVVTFSSPDRVNFLRYKNHSKLPPPIRPVEAIIREIMKAKRLKKRPLDVPPTPSTVAYKAAAGGERNVFFVDDDGGGVLDGNIGIGFEAGGLSAKIASDGKLADDGDW